LTWLLEPYQFEQAEPWEIWVGGAVMETLPYTLCL
jgi:hypothetical protein